MDADVVKIAEVCHEANRAYCATLGDMSQKPWEDAPNWQRQSAIKGVQFHVDQHSQGITPSQSASHDSWLQEKKDTGWSWGPVKDEAKKEHPCFVPYEQLPLDQQKKDALFGSIVKALM